MDLHPFNHNNAEKWRVAKRLDFWNIVMSVLVHPSMYKTMVPFVYYSTRGH